VGGELADRVQDDATLNEKALEVIDRISSKLRGKDFKTPQPLDVRDQVLSQTTFGSGLFLSTFLFLHI
jgi:hypothetical protein